MKLHDEDIREPLFEFLEAMYGKARVLEEINIGRSRADVVLVITDAVVGIEIKSDADTYTRLAGQVKDYDRYFDFNYVVVGITHAHHIEDKIPDYWGIITVEVVGEELDFYVLRKPRTNPKFKLDRKLGLLWKRELSIIQAANKMPKYADKSRPFIVKKVIERTKYPEDKKGYIDIDKLNTEISDVLFERDYTVFK